MATEPCMTTGEAQSVYRDAWTSYLMSSDDEVKKELEEVMDSCQPFCVESGRPGPEWDAFTETLPGFREFWDGFSSGAKRFMEAMGIEK